MNETNETEMINDEILSQIENVVIEEELLEVSDAEVQELSPVFPSETDLEYPTLEMNSEESVEEIEESAEPEVLDEEQEDDFGREEISEAEKEFDFDDYIGDDDTPSYKLNTNNHSKDDDEKQVPLSGGATFQELLEQQLTLFNLDDDDPDDLDGVYADSFIVGHNAYKFVMKSGQHQEGKDKVKFHSKIICSPNDTKNLSEILAETVADYESDHGLIKDD